MPSYNWVFILSKGVTAKSDSVTPAPKPAITFAGPDTLPFLSAKNPLYVSNATNPVQQFHELVIPASDILHTDLSLLL